MNENLKLYRKFQQTIFSQDCKCQGLLMLQALEDYLLNDNDLKHSLLRLAIRPLYYTGYVENLNDVITTIKDTSDEFFKLKQSNKFIDWLKDNSSLVDTIFKELNILDDCYEEEVFDALKGLNLSDDEIFRIFTEEQSIDK
ncbi:MAG: hypothetical protein ACI4WH_01910 [Oscillospiraceae bacterium]